MENYVVYRPVSYPERNNLHLLEDRPVGRTVKKEKKRFFSSLSNTNKNSIND